MIERKLKPGWKVCRFDQMAFEVKDRIDRPVDSGLERYVGLEHLDSGSLKIWRWGSTSDVEKPKLLFKSGDIIFGRRNAYLRRVAVADFDGVCSAHAMVLRAHEDVVLPDFLPLYMQTDTFWETALKVSAGSMSPTINWRNIAEEEFALPPPEEQCRIANTLWASEKIFQNLVISITRISTLKSAALSKWTNHGLANSQFKRTSFGDIPESWRVITIGQVLDACQYGLSMQVHDEGDYPIFRMMNIDDGRMVANDMKYVRLSKDEFERYRVLPGDILFNRTNSDDLVGKLGIFDLPGDYVFASYLIRLQVNRTKVMPEYLNYFMNSLEGQQRIRSYATKGVSQTNINATNLQKVLFPLPPMNEQKEIVRKLLQIDSSKSELILQREKKETLKHNLLNSFL